MYTVGMFPVPPPALSVWAPVPLKLINVVTDEFWVARVVVTLPATSISPPCRVFPELSVRFPLTVTTPVTSRFQGPLSMVRLFRTAVPLLSVVL